ncbi:MAG: SET domain-containing protein-lysine N-methyltransferase, partial [Gemmatimonadota bacterium]|nr:SET domain-containing protein-lysine N-methyltransferase [Gemmatimonadota bacterium]
TENIRRGRKVIEYLGEPITHEEADRRYDDDDAKGRHHTFLFILNDDTVLDARRTRCDAKYLNHSCDPNCESVIEDDHIWIQAIKPIKGEEELVYDYQFEFEDDYEPEDIRYYACRCGTDKCRGTILKVPAYLRSTVRKWLAGDDVKRPPKPGSKAALRLREARKKASAKKKVAATKRKQVAVSK